MVRNFSELPKSEQLLLLGHCLNAVGVLLLSIGSIIRAAGNLPEGAAFGFEQGRNQVSARDYF